MKKLLVLVLVLVLSSAASAVTSTLIVETDKDMYNAGEIAVVSIVTGPEFTGAMGSWLGSVAFDVTAAETTTDVTASLGTLISTLTANLGWSNGTLVNVPPLLIEDVIGKAAMSSGVQGGVTIYTFDLDVGTSAGYATIGLADITGASPFNAPHTISGVGKEICIIPEPMTIALLGLGGLFLRRRK